MDVRLNNPRGKFDIGTLPLDEAMAAKTSFKNWFTFFQPLLRLFLPILFIKSKRASLELNSWDPFLSSEREINFGRRLFTSSIKRNVQKSDARTKLLFCLANLLFLFDDPLIVIASSERRVPNN